MNLLKLTLPTFLIFCSILLTPSLAFTPEEKWLEQENERERKVRLRGLLRSLCIQSKHPSIEIFKDRDYLEKYVYLIPSEMVPQEVKYAVAHNDRTFPKIDFDLNSSDSIVLDCKERMILGQLNKIIDEFGNRCERSQWTISQEGDLKTLTHYREYGCDNSYVRRSIFDIYKRF